jgi:sigma-B regulation protein RsbU (phosphoserine phosphatase)
VLGLDLSARSRPALEVGGDFFDLIQQPGQPFVFAVGDVSGKGMSAALLMAMSRTVIRSRANSLASRSPDEIMAHVNEDLYDDFTEVSMFATAFIAQYHQAQQQLVHVNAGHSPVIYCRAGGQPELLEADGTAIGVLPISFAENHVLPFGPGDLLIAATDGFSEARNQADELFGYDRLLQLAAELREQSAQHISEALFQAVDRFGAGHPQDDDQTLVVVKGVAV